jgi:hypothetical protein
MSETAIGATVTARETVPFGGWYSIPLWSRVPRGSRTALQRAGQLALVFDQQDLHRLAQSERRPMFV